MGALFSSSETTASSNKPSCSNVITRISIPSRAYSLVIKFLKMALSELGFSNHKMIFVVNMDLNMGRGKQCAQVAHAALGLYLKIQQSNNDNEMFRIYQWLTMGQKKIVVRGDNLQHMKNLQEAAEVARLSNLLVSDAGCTQIAPGSKTVLAIFGTDDELEGITGPLRLL